MYLVVIASLPRVLNRLPYGVLVRAMVNLETDLNLYIFRNPANSTFWSVSEAESTFRGDLPTTGALYCQLE